MTAVDIGRTIGSRVRDIADYPSPGIVFKDITPLLADGDALAAVVEAFAAPFRNGGAASARVDLVAGIEARGFILAAPVAVALGVGFVPMRKAGRLPHATVSAAYALEYGTAEIEVHADAVLPGHRVLVIDDVLATGGTAAAACDLIERLGGTVAGLSFLLELEFLEGRSRLAGQPLTSLLAI